MQQYISARPKYQFHFMSGSLAGTLLRKPLGIQFQGWTSPIQMPENKKNKKMGNMWGADTLPFFLFVFLLFSGMWIGEVQDRHQVPNLAFSRMPKTQRSRHFFLLKKQVNPMSSNFRPNAENSGARKQFQGCRIPRLHCSKVTCFQESTIASLHGFKAPRFQNSRVAGFQTFPGFQGCNVTGQKFQASQGCRFPRF